MDKLDNLYLEDQVYSKLKIRCQVHNILKVSSVRTSLWPLEAINSQRVEYSTEAQLTVFSTLRDSFSNDHKESLIGTIINEIYTNRNCGDLIVLPKLPTDEESKNIGGNPDNTWSEEQAKAGKKEFVNNDNVQKFINFEQKDNQLSIEIFERTSILKRLKITVEEWLKKKFSLPTQKKNTTWQIFFKSLYKSVDVPKIDQKTVQQITDALNILGKDKKSSRSGNIPVRGRGRGQRGRGRR